MVDLNALQEHREHTYHSSWYTTQQNLGSYGGGSSISPKKYTKCNTNITTRWRAFNEIFEFSAARSQHMGWSTLDDSSSREVRDMATAAKVVDENSKVAEERNDGSMTITTMCWLNYVGLDYRAHPQKLFKTLRKSSILKRQLAATVLNLNVG